MACCTSTKERTAACWTSTKEGAVACWTSTKERTAACWTSTTKGAASCWTSTKKCAVACWTSRACVVLVQILLFFKGPGITIADCGTDIANTIYLSDHCILPTFHRDTWELDWDPCVCNHTEDTGFNITGNTTVRLNCTEVRDPDPIWAAWSIWFFFNPGWILATYLGLSFYFSDEDQDWGSQVEIITIAVFGLFGLYSVILLIMQIFSVISPKKAKENEFITDYLPLMMGIEAFGESAPQVVLNGFAIARKYPLSKIQVASLAFSLLGTSLRVLDYDMIAESDEEETNEEETGQKIDWWKKWPRKIILFFFYLLSNIARSFSLCLLFLYCQKLAVIPVFLNSLLIFLLIKFKTGGDIASSFLFSVNNFFICSNGGPDDIAEKAHRLMATTSLICLTNFTAWQFGSMYYAYKHNHIEDKFNYNGQHIDFGVLGVANQAWVCGWVLVLNLFHFLILRILNDVGWLPKTEYELDMMKKTTSRKQQMKQEAMD